MVEIQKFPNSDPRLDWVSKHDSKSLNFLARSIPRMSSVKIEPRRWRSKITLDQGREGACVGFAWTQELLTSPRPDDVEFHEGNTYAREYYYECKRKDQWEGEDYSGTSVLAGAKVAVDRGLIGSYHWCTSIEELRDSVIALGPVVIGIPWYKSMYRTRPSGLVEVGDDLVGGHAILIDEYHPGKRLRYENWHERFEGFGFHNSWSDSYGIDGRGFIRTEDLRDLLGQWGEACVPTERKMVRLP